MGSSESKSANSEDKAKGTTPPVTNPSDEQNQDIVEEVIQPKSVASVFNMISAPTDCPPGYKRDHKGNCRKMEEF